MRQEERHLLVAGGLGDRLVSVKDENDRSREARQLIEQDREHGSCDIRVVHPKLPGFLLAGEPRASPLQRMHDVPPQPARVILAVIEREPGKRPPFHPADLPLRHESRLAEAGRRVDENEFGGGRGNQALNRLLPLDQVLTQSGSMELRLDRDVMISATRYRGLYRAQAVPRSRGLVGRAGIAAHMSSLVLSACNRP